MNKNNREFLSRAVADLVMNKVKVTFEPKDCISFGEEFQQLGGYFVHHPKELVVATGIPFHRWFGVFIHEYCHYRQWIEGADIWIKTEDAEASEKFDVLISGGIDFTKKEVNSFCNLVQKFELDCEKRVIAFIDEFELELDKAEYIKKANAYIFLYSYIKDAKRWPDKTSPYKVKAIVDLMPSEFLRSYKTPPKKYVELVTRYCYK